MPPIAKLFWPLFGDPSLRRLLSYSGLTTNTELFIGFLCSLVLFSVLVFFHLGPILNSFLSSYFYFRATITDYWIVYWIRPCLHVK